MQNREGIFERGYWASFDQVAAVNMGIVDRLQSTDGPPDSQGAIAVSSGIDSVILGADAVDETQ
jgi:hypothetical protein